MEGRRAGGEPQSCSPLRDVALVESEMPTDGQRIDDGSESVFWTEILTRVDQFWLDEPPTSH